MLAKQQVSYVGASVASAEEWHLRQKYQGIARDVFGEGVMIAEMQIPATPQTTFYMRFGELFSGVCLAATAVALGAAALLRREI